jgi:hypothetical protein
MRFAAIPFVLLLAACPRGGTGGNECNVDDHCDDQICARDNMCTDPANVREVRTTWTIGGQAASSGVCGARELYITFQSNDSSEDLNFSPVPCPTGQFVIDKLPNRYMRLELGIAGGGFESAAIDTTNAVVIDLPL